jgi:hypothetical protein
VKDIKSFYKNYLVWLCCQSEANLSLPAIWEMQGDFAELQGRRRLVPAEDPGISMGWIGVSLTQEQGDPHSIAGKVDLETPRQRFHAAHFNVRFRAPFGHRRATASQRHLLQREVRLSAKREHPRAHRIAQADGRTEVASISPHCLPDMHQIVALGGRFN